MSAFQVSNNTIDLVVQAAYKYRICTKRERTLFGRTLWMVNRQSLAERYGDTEPTLAMAEAAYPAFTSFPRKFKRLAVHGAIACFQYQSCESASWFDSETRRLLDIVAEKNAVKAGKRPVTEWVAALDDNGEVIMSEQPDGWEPEYDGEFVPSQTGEYVQRQSATQVWTQELQGIEVPRFWDITDEQRDPEVEADNSVMVRPIEVIRAEREVERERIMAERTARIAVTEAEVSRQAALDGDDDSEESWDDVDDEFMDDDDA